MSTKDQVFHPNRFYERLKRRLPTWAQDVLSGLVF
jgi:hypothetical protein